MKTTKIFQEIREELSKYLSIKEVNQFFRQLAQDSHEKDNIYDFFNREDKEQISYELPSGSPKRDQVDSLITFAVSHLKQPQYLELFLHITQLLRTNDEYETGTDLAEYILSIVTKQKQYTLIRAETYLVLSKIEWSQSNWTESMNYVKKAYKNFGQLDHNSGYVKCEIVLGNIYGEKGDLEKAKLHYELGLEILKSLDDKSMEAKFQINLGIISCIRGEYYRANQYYKSALENYQEMDEPKQVARLHHNLAMLYSNQKKYEKALEEFNNSINVSLEKNYLSNCAISYIGKAFVYTKLKNVTLADAFAEKAMEIACKINDRLSIADIYRIKGIIRKETDNFELSEELFENSIRLNEDFKSKANVAETSVELGELYVQQGKNEDGKELIKRAEKYYKKINAGMIIKKIAKSAAINNSI